jgi:hypothetical protein
MQNWTLSKDKLRKTEGAIFFTKNAKIMNEFVLNYRYLWLIILQKTLCNIFYVHIFYSS